jgi:hypothetical protein
MISAHLAAEMDLAMRLDQKLEEVSTKLEAQRFQDKDGSASSQNDATIISSARTVSGICENGKSSAETEYGMHTASKDVPKKARSSVDLNSSLYAKLEWDMLMGKEVNVLP